MSITKIHTQTPQCTPTQYEDRSGGEEGGGGPKQGLRFQQLAMTHNRGPHQYKWPHWVTTGCDAGSRQTLHSNWEETAFSPAGFSDVME